MAARDVTRRKSAEQRREEIVRIAIEHFALGGYNGTSTEAIARDAGISQPYLFRLFGTKKRLYLETTSRRMEDTYTEFERASRGKAGEDALRATGQAYTELMADRDRVLLMLQCFADCDDDDIRANARRVWRDLVELIEQRSGMSQEEVSAFFAKGMLLTITLAMKLDVDPTPWGDRLIAGCGLAFEK
jgi:AcrR family transcriptional regulator